MKELILHGYELLTVILPFVIVFILLRQIYKCKKIEKVKSHFIMVFIFSVYIFVVFYFTGVATIFDLQRYGIQIDTRQINLLPFSKDIDVVAYIENILLFIPFGCMLPFIWTNTYKLRYTVLSGFTFSLLIEISQLFNNRQTDIDDLLLNTLGVLLGYLLFKLFAHVMKRNDKPGNYYNCELIIHVIAMFLGHFLLFNEFGLAKILYGF